MWNKLADRKLPNGSIVVGRRGAEFHCFVRLCDSVVASKLRERPTPYRPEIAEKATLYLLPNGLSEVDARAVRPYRECGDRLARCDRLIVETDGVHMVRIE